MSTLCRPEPPGAPSAGAFRARKPAQTSFSKRYRCGDLPVSVDHGHSKPAIRWLVEPERLDLHYYLPLFFDGLRETRFPESMLARQGVVTLIEMGGDDCVGIIGKLTQPIKAALNTRDPGTIILCLNTVAKLVRDSPLPPSIHCTALPHDAHTGCLGGP